MTIQYFSLKIKVFNDARKFGFVDLVTTTKINNKKYIDSLGIDALSENLTIEYLYSKIKTSNVPIKQILLNQKIISGIGNIYASEILFDAKISPFIKGKFVKLNEVKILIMSIKKILLKAIDSGGSTLRDYVSANGTLGNFQNNFKVYNREGLKIEGQRIKRVIQYQRSTFYCPKLQKKTKKK